MRLSRLAAAVSAACLVPFALVAGLSSPASASALVTATTTFSNYPAVGGGYTGTSDAQYAWAVDNFTRTLTVQVDNDASDCSVLGGFSGTADTCYSASVSDTGTATTLPGHLQPNQQVGYPGTGDGNTLSTPPETIPFSGSANYLFYVPDADNGNIAAGNVPPTENLGFNASSSSIPSSVYSYTSSWDTEALGTNSAEAVSELVSNWQWAYGAAGCENWNDAFANDGGQSSPASIDGNVTGAACTPAPPVTTTPPPVTTINSGYGDFENVFGNGWDAYRQGAYQNNVIVSWPVTAADPAVHFILQNEGSNVRVEYAPYGTGDGLCVSNPGNNTIVLRYCNSNVWQQFRQSGKYVISVVTGGYVNPDGTGADLRVSSAPVEWGGSAWGWTAVN